MCRLRSRTELPQKHACQSYILHSVWRKHRTCHGRRDEAPQSHLWFRRSPGLNWQDRMEQRTRVCTSVCLGTRIGGGKAGSLRLEQLGTPGGDQWARCVTLVPNTKYPGRNETRGGRYPSGLVLPSHHRWVMGRPADGNKMDFNAKYVSRSLSSFQVHLRDSCNLPQIPASHHQL